MITDEMMKEIRETAEDMAAEKAGRTDAVTELYRTADALAIAGIKDGLDAEAEAIKKALHDFPEIDTLAPAYYALLDRVVVWMDEVKDAYPEVREVVDALKAAELAAVENMG